MKCIYKLKSLYNIDNFICSKIRKFCSIALFSEERVIQRYINRKYKRYVNEYHYPTQFNDGKNIWIFWWQGEKQMPKIVSTCYNSICKNKGNYQVILLDKNNYTKYVNIPPYILEKFNKGNITITHFSDILRFNLLDKYGGWWLDATIYLSKPITNLKTLYTIKMPYTSQYISHARWSGFLWYMPQYHPLASFVKDCLHMYWKEKDQLIAYFLIDHFINLFYNYSSKFKKEINNISIDNKKLYFFQESDSLLPYCEREWEEIVKNNQFFKCNWKFKLQETDRQDTYFHKILVHSI